MEFPGSFYGLARALLLERLVVPPEGRLFQVQNHRKPRRCQEITVAGLTMTRADCQSPQSRQSQAHKRRPVAVHFGFSTYHRSTPSWWRRARVSSYGVARLRKEAPWAPQKAEHSDSNGQAEPNFKELQERASPL